MKKAISLLSVALVALALHAQTDPRITRTKTPLSQIEQVLMPYFDNTALLEAEQKRWAPGVAPKFAENIEVAISPATHGQWEYLPQGKALWRLRIRSAGAKSLNLGFSKYYMPPGGTMILYSPDYKQVMGPFSPSDNEEHEQLWTPVLPGDEIVIEVKVPSHALPDLQLQLKYVNHDFLGFAEIASGSCNLDVICGAADGWSIVDAYRDIIQSVAVIGANGSTFCTGFLINNARQDCTPYFMTAFHCGIDASTAPSLVAYWNYQNSFCRQPNSPASGQSGNGDLNDFNTGAVFKAGWNPSDFTLVEFDDPVSPTSNGFFAGWNATGTPQDTSICVHHPNTDEKRITFDFETAEPGIWTGNVPLHWYVEWDLGVTEPGSSGSPLFDQDHRVVGQLSGGPSGCSSSDLHDYYGMFHKSWEGGGTPATRLKDWLDPDNSGATSLDGRYLMQCSFFVDGSPASQQICAPSNAVFEISVSDNFTAPVNLTLNGPPAGLTVQFANNPVPPGGSTTLTLSGTGTVSPGTYYFQLSGTDGVETGNSILSLFIANQPPDGLHAISPANGASGLNLTPTFSWSPAPNATYSFQLATDANFSNLLANESGLTTTTYQPNSLLNISTTYFWRVNATNICGAGDWSTPFSFSTGAIACGDFNATNLPLPIGPDGGTVTVSKFMVNAVGFIDDVNVVDIDISHTYIGDLRMELTSPTGTTVQIMGNPNCDLADMLVTFNDESSNTYNDFENICEPSAPAVAGAFQPLSPLSAFDGEWAEGEWTLTVYDDADADGGSLNSWSLEICSTLPDGTSILVIEDPISCEGQSSSFEVLLGVGFAAPVTLSASNLPSGVTATFSPNPGNAGSPVTVNLSGAPNAGNYIFDLSATDGVNTGLTTVAWDVITTPAAPSLISPAQNATGVAPKPVFTWQAVPGVSYTIEVATDLAFTNIVESASALPSNQHTAINFLMGLTTYYWRVIPVNDCGAGEPSTIFSFTTGTFNCLARFYEGSQVPILDFEISNAIISFTSPGLIQDVNIAGIDISHTYIGDLSIFLTSPSGTVVSLLDFIDCSEADMLLTFDDEASLTNQDLQNSCSSAMPAVSGAFQPAQPLSSLIGENAAGDWTLTILDQAFDDVGFLHGWSLEICTSAPNDLSITPAVESVNSCETQFATFPIFLGQAFEPAITLSATGLPAGATATFEPNPASPGATVTVTLSNNAPTGSYPIEIIANDGVNISTATLDWNVTTTPGNPTASSPFPGQTNVGLTPTLNWTNISGANGYIIKVSTNPDLSNPIVETLVNSLSLNLTNLNFCTTYYWSVDAYNDCGVSSNPAIYPFTTLSNFDFQLSEPSGSSCANGDLSFEIEIGECYDPTGVALAIAGLPAGSAAAFSNNPAQPGSTVTVTLSLSNAVTGVFPISITGTDGSYSATATYSLTVLAPAAAPQLVFPADNQTNVSTSPTFDWNPVNGAVSYRLELTLASDPQFQDVLLIINTTQTGHTITTPLSTEGTYLWRVTAFNACGGAAPTVFTFQTEGENATWDLSGNQVQILPNPTSGVVLVNFSQPLGEAVEAVLFTVAGVATTKIQMQPGNQYGSLNLSEQPSGLYLLKLTTSKATVVERIVLDK